MNLVYIKQKCNMLCQSYWERMNSAYLQYELRHLNIDEYHLCNIFIILLENILDNECEHYCIPCQEIQTQWVWNQINSSKAQALIWNSYYLKYNEWLVYRIYLLRFVWFVSNTMLLTPHSSCKFKSNSKNCWSSRNELLSYTIGWC